MALIAVGRLRALLGLAVLAPLPACSATDVLNGMAPRAGIDVRRDVAYGAEPRQRLDVYAPAAAAGAPVVVFFYGGGWESGDKADYEFVAAALAARGIVAVVPDYRLYPTVRYPAFLEDGARAVAWAHAQARALGGDPSRLVLAGHSAGAYIAAMLTLDCRWLAEAGLDIRATVAGMIGIAGPYDFLPLHSPTLKAIFGPPETLPETQPIHYVDGTAPPMLLVTGTGDDTVDPGNSARLAARIREAGGTAEVVSYPGVGHRAIIGAVAWPLRFLAPTLADLVRFAVAARPVPAS